MPDSKFSKVQLRSDLRQRRQALSPAQQHLAAEGLTVSIAALPGWPGSQRIALYLPADGEIGTGPLAELARSQDKRLYLPVIEEDQHLSFAAWQTGASLLSNRYGIPEPPTGAELCPVAGLDIIFMPVVGWDLAGGRLGMGGGFYDRTLSGVAGPLLVGLAHDFQQVDSIPQEDWDISLNFIATETALHCCQGRVEPAGT